jgi:hypothetical protein
MTETTSEDVMRLEARVRHHLAGRGCHLPAGGPRQRRCLAGLPPHLLRETIRPTSGQGGKRTAGRLMRLKCLKPLGNQPRESETLLRGYPDGEV